MRDVEQVDQSNPRLRDCVADIAAALRWVPRDELVDEHIRQHRRTMRLVRGGVTGLTVLLITTLAAAEIAMNQRDQQAKIATAFQLVVQAESARDTDPRTALRLGIAAQIIYPSSETRFSLVNTLSALSVTEDGRALATASSDKKVPLRDLTGLNYLRNHAIKRACSLAGSGLNRDEWALYIPRLAYQKTCTG